MNSKLPSFLDQGETARLFPVLSMSSKEARITSILLGCVSRINELAKALLETAGQRVGTRATVECYTEVVPKKLATDSRDRPDGLVVLRVGSRRWAAFVEAKIGNSELEADQIERYRNLAKENGVDCVITISNQFATVPTIHPLEEVRKSRSKIPVIHWSWLFILTNVDLLMNQDSSISDDQLILLNEFRRFLAHDSAGVRSFDRMPKEWTELNKIISAGGDISTSSQDAIEILEAWHQEARDLSLALSRLTETNVTQRLQRRHLNDPVRRQRDELARLRTDKQLSLCLDVPDAAAPLDVVVDLSRRCVDVGMTVTAPEDRKSSNARMNWLLRQIKQDEVTDLHVRVTWPNRSLSTQHSVADLRKDVGIVNSGKEKLAAKSFHLFVSRYLGSRFIQRTKFISDLEQVVAAFYGNYGAGLVAWQRPAPKIKTEGDGHPDASTEAILEEADSFLTEAQV